MTDFFD